MRYLSMHSPVGELTLFEDDDHLVVLEWGRAGAEACEDAATSGPTPLLAEAKAQLDAYFDGKLTEFDLPYKPPHGTLFQRAVWDHIKAIPYAETRTYLDLARALDSAPRPVGGACGKNPLPIIVPCHRVVASGGRLGGYSGGIGLETKRVLLNIEGAAV